MLPLCLVECVTFNSHQTPYWVVQPQIPIQSVVICTITNDRHQPLCVSTMAFMPIDIYEMTCMCYVIIITTYEVDDYHYPHFMDEEVEAQRGLATCSGSPS